MELDLGKIAEKMIRDLEERITFAEQQVSEHSKKKEQLQNVILGVKLLYAQIETEIKRIQSESEKKDEPTAEPERFTV